MSRNGLGRNHPCFCGSGKKYKKCCYPRTLPDFRLPNAGIPYPHQEQEALDRALDRLEALPPQEGPMTIDKVDVGRTRLHCVPLPPYEDNIALPGTLAPPTPFQIEAKYREIKEGNPEGAAEVVVTYTYPEPSGFAEARMLFDADERFRLACGRTVGVLDLFRDMQVVMANGSVGTIVGNPERRYDIPVPPLREEDGLWTSRVVGRVKHTAHEIVEFRWGGQMVRVTPGHVVWSADRRGWVGARELRPGELIRVVGNRVAPVEGSRCVPGRIEVFGIEVEYFHNYFVGGGPNAMLVHNGPDCVVKPRTYESVDEGGSAASSAGGSRSPNVPDLSGMSRADAHIAIREAGYEYHGTTAGGYVRYRHPSGAEIWIRPNGEVVRLGEPVVPEGGGRPYRPRIDYQGNRIPTHSTGEFVTPLPGRSSP